MLMDHVVEKHWDAIKDRIKTRYGMVTDEDLETTDKNPRRLVGVIQERTGRPMNEIENYLERITEEECTMADQIQGRAQEIQGRAQEIMGEASRTVQEQYGKVSRQVQEGYEKGSAKLKEGYDQAEQTIRSKPGESVMVSFGVGLIAGVMVGLMVRGR